MAEDPLNVYTPSVAVAFAVTYLPSLLFTVNFSDLYKLCNCAAVKLSALLNDFCTRKLPVFRAFVNVTTPVPPTGTVTVLLAPPLIV